MGMSPEEKEQYLATRGPELEALIDALFVKQCGRSYNDLDMKRVRLPHGQQNGSARGAKDLDSLAKIKADYPTLFGGDVS